LSSKAVHFASLTIVASTNPQHTPCFRTRWRNC